MESVRVGINGFGRIGRSLARIIWERRVKGDRSLQLVAVNDLTSPDDLLNLVKYDSVMGRFPGAVSLDSRDNELVISEDHPWGNLDRVQILCEDHPSKLPWKELGVDVVIEATGRFTSHDQAKLHLQNGAKKVIISAPSVDPDIMAVMGVNFDQYDPKKHDVISNASCTTTCLAPIVKVLNDVFGVEKGIMNTIHAYTISQRIQDSPHSDARRGRAAATNLIPTSTGAARSVARVIPELEGKLNGFSVRAPVIAGSLINFYCELSKEVTTEEVNAAFKAAAKTLEYEGIIEYSDDPIVSGDVVGNAYSAIFDAPMTMVVDGNLVTVSAWYDNEWGYSNRLADTAARL